MYFTTALSILPIKRFVAYCTSRVLLCTEQQSRLVIISQPLCLLRSQRQLVEGEDSRIHPLYTPKPSCALGSCFTRRVVWETSYPLFIEVDYPNPNVMIRSVRVPRSYWHTSPSESSARSQRDSNFVFLSPAECVDPLRWVPEGCPTSAPSSASSSTWWWTNRLKRTWSHLDQLRTSTARPSRRGSWESRAIMATSRGMPFIKVSNSFLLMNWLCGTAVKHPGVESLPEEPFIASMIFQSLADGV